MSRYIDADALKEWLDEYLSVFKKYDKCTIKGFVDHAPSIDIVRCNECKYEPICNHSVQHTTYDAHSITIGSKTVEWCSYGERRTDE